mgnify:CR=1 FL=1
MTTWEYATVPLLVHATKQILDTWGQDGWELVQVLVLSVLRNLLLARLGRLLDRADHLLRHIVGNPFRPAAKLEQASATLQQLAAAQSLAAPQTPPERKLLPEEFGGPWWLLLIAIIAVVIWWL